MATSAGGGRIIRYPRVLQLPGESGRSCVEPPYPRQEEIECAAHNSTGTDTGEPLSRLNELAQSIDYSKFADPARDENGEYDQQRCPPRLDDLGSPKGLARPKSGQAADRAQARRGVSGCGVVGA